MARACDSAGGWRHGPRIPGTLCPDRPRSSAIPVAFHIAKAVSLGAFLVYGTLCLTSDHMVAEFERYGLAPMRRLVGSLEVAGALGLAAGYAFAPLDVAASAGLSLLMLAGVATRVRIRDGLILILPASTLALVNAFVCWQAWERLTAGAASA